MSVKQPSLGGLTAWFAVLAIFPGFIFGTSTPLDAGAIRQDAAEQEKDKKEEKKNEKKGLPLKSSRKIEFTTDEGTWLSLDVSPDGKSIAFELVATFSRSPSKAGRQS